MANLSMIVEFGVLLSTILAVQGERVWFGGDSGTTDPNVIDGQDYNSHNIFVVDGTKLTLQSGSITAPDSGDDGEDAVRVVNANFHAISGKISGGQGVGGTGVTITTERNSEYPNGTATFEAGVEVYGGDAVRETTTQGGDAIQVLQGGSTVIINGGKFVRGTGCTIKVCGTPTSDGVALQVIMGEAIIKGGTFEGALSNINGIIELHGCVEYDQDAGKVTGVLLDGSDIDAEFSGQIPKIVYVTDVCPQNDQTPTPESSSSKQDTIAPSTTPTIAFKVQGLLWLDENANGLYDSSEPSMEGVFVNLRACDSDQWIGTTTSDVFGQYQFDGMEEGEYYVEFFKPNQLDYDFTLPNVAGNDIAALDSDVISEFDGNKGRTDCMEVKRDDFNNNKLTKNAGFIIVETPNPTPAFAPSSKPSSDVIVSVTRECNQVLEVETSEKFTEVQMGIYELLMESYKANIGEMVSRPQIFTTCEVTGQDLAGGKRRSLLGKVLGRFLQSPRILLVMQFKIQYETRYGYDIEDYPRQLQAYINSNLEKVTEDMNSRFLPVIEAQEVIVFNTNEPTFSPSALSSQDANGPIEVTTLAPIIIITSQPALPSQTGPVSPIILPAPSSSPLGEGVIYQDQRYYTQLFVLEIRKMNAIETTLFKGILESQTKRFGLMLGEPFINTDCTILQQKLAVQGSAGPPPNPGIPPIRRNMQQDTANPPSTRFVLQVAYQMRWTSSSGYEEIYQYPEGFQRYMNTNATDIQNELQDLLAINPNDPFVDEVGSTAFIPDDVQIIPPIPTMTPSIDFAPVPDDVVVPDDLGISPSPVAAIGLPFFPTVSPAPSSNRNFCGVSKEDAQKRCDDVIPCPDGLNSTCLYGQSCFRITGPCGTTEDDTPSGSNVDYTPTLKPSTPSPTNPPTDIPTEPHVFDQNATDFCGAGYWDALNNCDKNKICPRGDGDCPVNQTCFPGMNKCTTPFPTMSSAPTNGVTTESPTISPVTSTPTSEPTYVPTEDVYFGSDFDSGCRLCMTGFFLQALVLAVVISWASMLW